MRALLAAVLRDIARRLDDRTPPATYGSVSSSAPATIDAEAIITAIKQRNRRKGLSTADI